MHPCTDYTSQIPNEMLIRILYNLLSAKDLLICQRVCRRWKDLIQDMIVADDTLWKQHCKSDFKSVYEEARKKTCGNLSWFELYRTLSLWGWLATATEVIEEFCHTSRFADEINSIDLVDNTKLVVHKRSYVAFYDPCTLQLRDQEYVTGIFLSYEDHGHFVVTHGSQLHLKIHFNDNKDETVINNVKFFLVANLNIYLVNLSNEIFVIKIEAKEVNVLKIITTRKIVISLSHCKRYLHYLTSEGDIYAHRKNDEEPIKVCELKYQINHLFECIQNYEFIEKMDWTWFYQFASQIRATIPGGLLRYINIIKKYGNIYFVGTRNCVLLVYYRPFTNGVIDLINHKPVRIYEFSKWTNNEQSLGMPVRNVQVIETINSHRVLVALPNRIVVLEYRHDLRNPGVSKIPFSRAVPASEFMWL